MKILEILQIWINQKVIEKYNKAVEADSIRDILFCEGAVSCARDLLAELGIHMETMPIKKGPYERSLISCKLHFFRDE